MKNILRKPLAKLRSGTSKINYQKLFYRVLSLAAICLLVSGYIAYTRLYLTPERRFWMAINNSLSLPSVSKSVQTGGTGNRATELTRFAYGSQAAQDKVNSTSFKNAVSENNVTTETITTPTSQYVKYLNIFSTEKKDDGSMYNFSSVIGKWAKQDIPKDKTSLDNQRLTYMQPFVTLVPFGNLSADRRNELLAFMKASGSYDVSYKDAKFEEVEGKRYVSYPVRVHTKKYVEVLQKYFTLAGFGDFPPLNPAGYSDRATVNATFKLETRGSTIAGISFNQQDENYGDNGVVKPITIPTSTLTLEELQSRLQSAQ